MSSAISDPFQLSSYPFNPRPGKQKTLAHLSASHSKSTSDGRVTLTVQEDGVHVLDLASNHPIISHTLGPTASFSCPAVTINHSQDGQNTATTFAPLSSPENSKKESEVLIWRDNLTTGISSQDQKSISLPHNVSSIHRISSSCVAALSSEGHLSFMTPSAEISATQRLFSESLGLLTSFSFGAKDCKFIISNTKSLESVIVALYAASAKKTVISLYLTKDGDNGRHAGELTLDVDPKSITGSTLNETGFLTLLDTSGRLRKYQLEPSASLLATIRHLGDDVLITSLSFTQKPFPSEISTLALTSYHILLAGVTSSPSDPEIILLLWDLQYSVLLASQKMSISQSLSRSKDRGLRVHLEKAGSGHALLVLTPKGTPNTASRSIVYVIPFTVPRASTIANAMGKAEDGKKWLVCEQGPSSGVTLSVDDGKKELLKKMRNAMEENDAKRANATFFEWENEVKSKKAKVDYPHSFVKKLLDLCLQPQKAANVVYTPGVVRHLLQHRVVSGNMVEGGLLYGLRQREDWTSVELAFSTVIDLTEAEILSNLQAALAFHRLEKEKETDPNSMRVDSASTPASKSLGTVPSIDSLLAKTIRYPKSPSSLRLAIKHNLNGAEELTIVLGLLEKRIGLWREKEERGLVLDGKKKKEGHASIEEIMAFTQCILDSSFLTLLQHPASHPILRRIFSLLQPELTAIEELEELRGPLQPFAQAQAKAEKLTKSGKKGGKGGNAEDWRQRGKEIRERVGVAVGSYRLEELTI